MPQITTLQVSTQHDENVHTFIDLSTLDNDGIAMIHQEIRQFIADEKSYDFLSATEIERAEQTLAILASEIDHRHDGQGSTHALIDPTFVSDRALSDVYFIQLRNREESTLIYPGNVYNKDAMKKYRRKCKTLEEASKNWPIYRYLQYRGIALDLGK